MNIYCLHLTTMMSSDSFILSCLLYIFYIDVFLWTRSSFNAKKSAKTRGIYRPLVVFSHSQFSKNLQSKHCHYHTFSKLFHFYFHFLSPVVVILSTRLAVILKFLYLYYTVLITKSLIDKQVKNNVLTVKSLNTNPNPNCAQNSKSRPK